MSNFIPTTILETRYNEEDGMKLDLAAITGGFTVTLFDDDCNEVVECRKWKDVDSAKTYFETLEF